MARPGCICKYCEADRESAPAGPPVAVRAASPDGVAYRGPRHRNTGSRSVGRGDAHGELGPVRGIVIGLCLSLPIWVAAAHAWLT